MSKRGMEMVVYSPKSRALAPFKKPRVVSKAMVMYKSPGYRPGIRRMYRGLNRRGVANRETGYVDLASAGYALDTTGSVTLLATIAQGASTSQRVGKKVVYKSIQGRGYALNGAAAVSNDVAFLIVYDRRPTGSVPLVTDILVSAASTSFNNDANSGRFKILKRVDLMLVGAPSVTTGTDTAAISTDFYLPLRNLPLTFKAAGTGAIGDIEEGALYLVTVGSVSAGTAAASLGMSFRIRYLDI